MLKELNHPEIEEVMRGSSVGRIGCVKGDLMYIVPVNYRYANDTVTCFSLPGMKIDMMRNNPNVCFEVEDIDDFNHWKSVICWGRYEEITDEEELTLMRPHYVEYMLRKRATLPSTPPAQAAKKQGPTLDEETPIFYRIRFTKMTGRLEEGV